DHLPAHDELLLVATGEGVRRWVPAGSPPVDLGHDLLGPLPGALPIDPAPLGVRRLGLVAEGGVLPEGRGQEETLTVPILRDVPEAELPPGPDREVGDVGA